MQQQYQVVLYMHLCSTLLKRPRKELQEQSFKNELHFSSAAGAFLASKSRPAQARDNKDFALVRTNSKMQLPTLTLALAAAAGPTSRAGPG